MMPEFNITFCMPQYAKKTTGTRFHHWYLFLVLPCLMLANASCTNSSSAGRNNADSLSALAMPKPGAVSAEEAARIKTACELWYDSALKQKGFNGEMLVAKNGNIVFEQYNGTTHLPGTDLISENTPMHIASVSKTFTAMAILKLLQNGKLNLEDEYSKYFPDFNYPGVTIRTLLNHRSGLPNYTHFLEKMGWDKKTFVTNQDILNFLITRKPELIDIAPPNSHFTYCNTNYALLALLIEKLTGESYADYLKQTFFIPLQMKNSYVFSLADTSKAVPSYTWKGKEEPFGFLDGVYGDKNIYTTVRDLLIWDQALCSNLLFTNETLQQAYAPYSNEKPGIRNYGLGWRMYIYPIGKKIIYHNGWWHGSNAAFIRLLDDNATIIVIGNKFTRAVYHSKILASVFDSFYGPPVDEEETDSVFKTGKIASNPVLKNPKVAASFQDKHSKKKN